MCVCCVPSINLCPGFQYSRSWILYLTTTIQRHPSKFCTSVYLAVALVGLHFRVSPGLDPPALERDWREGLGGNQEHNVVSFKRKQIVFRFKVRFLLESPRQA